MVTSQNRSQELAQQLELGHFWLSMGQVLPVLGTQTENAAEWALQIDDLVLATNSGGEL